MKVFLVKWEGEGSWIVLAEDGEQAIERFVDASEDWDSDDTDELEAVEVDMVGSVSSESVEDLRAG